MSVLTRSDLEASPLADLHALASTLNIDGFRRLRREDLIESILTRQAGDSDAAAEVPDADVDTGSTAAEPDAGAADEAPAPPRPRRRRRLGRLLPVEDDEEKAEPAPEPAPAERGEPEPAEPAEREPVARGRNGAAAEREAEQVVEGVVELQPNGSGFVRLVAGEVSDGDVYVSAAQVRRCELVDGDRVRGPVRPARRSERFPSLIRVTDINGAAAEEVVVGTRFDELAAAFPSVPLPFGDDDETLAAVVALAPIGRGSRVVIAGPSRAGKTELLRAIAAALSPREELTLEVALVGVRPEELSEWSESPLATTPPLSFAASADAQAQAIEQAVERGRRIAARGGDAVLLIDTLDGLHPPAARRALASARNLSEHGSLTIIATAARPFGGETTVVALDLALAGTGHLPALDAVATGSVRPDLLVGADGAAAIVKARAAALEAQSS
jgi:transcription termination factor Rho